MDDVAQSREANLRVGTVGVVFAHGILAPCDGDGSHEAGQKGPEEKVRARIASRDGHVFVNL